MKEKFKSGYSFRSETLCGDLVKTYVNHYSIGTIFIYQLMLSEDDLTELGFRLLRKFKSKGLYVRSIGFKPDSFKSIINEYFQEFYTQTNDKNG